MFVDVLNIFNKFINFFFKPSFFTETFHGHTPEQVFIPPSETIWRSLSFLSHKHVKGAARHHLKPKSSVPVGACRQRAKYAASMIKLVIEQSVVRGSSTGVWDEKINTLKVQHRGPLLHVYATKSSASRMRHPFSCLPPAVRAASCFCHDCPLYRSQKGK